MFMLGYIKKIINLMGIFIPVLILQGCVPFNLKTISQTNLNLDIDNKASPTALNLYLFKPIYLQQFKKLDFKQFFNRNLYSKFLEKEKEKNIELIPGKIQIFQIYWPIAGQCIGWVAEYRNFEQSTWKQWQCIPIHQDHIEIKLNASETGISEHKIKGWDL